MYNNVEWDARRRRISSRAGGRSPTLLGTCKTVSGPWFWRITKTIERSEGRFGLLLAPLFLFLLSEIFTDGFRVGQVVVGSLEDEVGAPDSKDPADPSEDQPRVDVRKVLVHEWGTGVGKGSLESLKVTVRGRN